ncbi:MAG: hypothetical protein H6993_12635 [Pseudomonadales bacterium]|nr:hypothetical protein [Pseudomonadales bacterium]MCP5184804.1 hypothetical protein [Pseudomonadales bacterium]
MKLRKTVFLLTVSVGAATAGQASETVLLNESPAYLCYRQTQLDSRMPDVEQCDVAIEYQSLERVDLAATYMNRGILLARAGKLKAALADQDKAIAIAPEMSQGFINRSNVRVRMKQYAQAMQDLDTAVGIGDVALGVAYYNRALLFQKIGDLDAARHDARKASALAPESLEYAEYSRALDAVDTLTQ